MTSMNYTFKELYNRVSKFLGTYGTNGPSGNDLADAKAMVKSGYMTFLTAYDWTFRRRYETLCTESGQYIYELPSDFGGLRTPFRFDSPSGYPPLEETSEARLVEIRGYGENASYPMQFAIRSGRYDPKIGQRYEAMFWPTPDSEYVLYYSYHTMPPMMEDDGDLPICGAEMAECLLYFCLAAAERQQDENAGVQHEAAILLLQRAIQMDKLREPRHVGSGGSMTAWQTARGSSRLVDVTGYSDSIG